MVVSRVQFLKAEMGLPKDKKSLQISPAIRGSLLCTRDVVRVVYQQEYGMKQIEIEVIYSAGR